MRFPFFRNRDSVKNGILISIRRTGDGFHPGLFKLLAKAIETLTDRKKEVIFLAYFQGMSDAAIARKLNLVRSTVCEHRIRSLELLKNTMEEYRYGNNR